MIKNKDVLKIGTRGSALALQQTQGIADRIRAANPGLEVEAVIIKTTGDRMKDVALVKIGGKGVFVKEIEEALQREEVDLAVHSMKDVPSEIPDGLEIGVVPQREDPRDALIARGDRRLEELPEGARIGTGSLRRGMQLKHALPHVEIIPIRGNLDTRIRKIDSEGLEGIVVAAAGLRRMGWTNRVSQFIPETIMIPAIGQGALALELRKSDTMTHGKIAFLNHERTFTAVSAERAFLKVFGGGCQLPIAAHAKLDDDGVLTLVGLIGSPDGSSIIRDEIAGAARDGEAFGKELAERILNRGGKEILEKILF